MLEALGERPGKSLPTAFHDWANTKAAYRFFANDNVSEERILAGHFSAKAMRVKSNGGPVLILQDTSEFSFKRVTPEKLASREVPVGTRQSKVATTSMSFAEC